MNSLRHCAPSPSPNTAALGSTSNSKSAPIPASSYNFLGLSFVKPVVVTAWARGHREDDDVHHAVEERAADVRHAVEVLAADVHEL